MVLVSLTNLSSVHAEQVFFSSNLEDEWFIAQILPEFIVNVYMYDDIDMMSACLLQIDAIALYFIMVITGLRQKYRSITIDFMG